MKYCAHCGNELLDEAVICPKCGCRAENNKTNITNVQNQKDLILVINILMIISCVLSGIAFLIPLAWTLPMTISLKRRLENHQPVSVAFKVCVILFVNVIAGILLFFVNTDDYIA